MKKIYALAWAVGFCLCALAQVEQMRTPLSPAYTILDQTPATMERPSSPQALASNIQSAFAYGKFKPGVGLEVTPFWLIKKVNYSVTDYLKAEAEKKDYGKLFLHHLAFSAATSSTDTFTIGHIAPGMGLSYGVRFLLWPGNISKKSKEKIDELLKQKGDKSLYHSLDIQNSIDAVLADIRGTAAGSLNAAAVKLSIDNNFKDAAGNPLTAQIADIKAEMTKKGDVPFTNNGYAYDFVNEYAKRKLPELEKKIETLSNELASAREGFMCEVGAAGLSVFQGNKFSSAYFAKAQVWGTLSYRVITNEKDVKQSIDAILLFRGTINDKVVDTSNYFDWGFKLQGNYHKWSLSAEAAFRYATKPAKVPDAVSDVKPKNYTYRVVANFDYKINDLLGLNISFGKAFDGISTQFDKGKEQSIIASGGLNVGIGKKEKN